MALPFLLSVLGSAAAGAGVLGTLSPLIAGSLGAGIGQAIQTGDIGEGIKTGLTAGLMGGIGGALAQQMGGAGAAAAATGGAGGAAAKELAAKAAMQGATTQAATQAAAQPGIMGSLFQNMQPGLTAGTPMPAGTPLSQGLVSGLQQGTLTGAGLGTALAGASALPPMEDPNANKVERPQADPADRQMYTPPAGFRPGLDPEFTYFNPYPVPSTYAQGGMVYHPTGMNTAVRMQAGGIADMGGMPGMAPAAPQMNDKDVVGAAIRAVRGELPEQQAAVVLGQFLQTFGEDALRRLVDDVRQGRNPRGGDMEGQIRGPGDGMDDLVPAQMDDGSQDVLLSDGEFIVPADVVSGLGNGSSDAGAAELERMMSRVREARTGKTEQPAQVAVGGLLPA